MDELLKKVNEAISLLSKNQEALGHNINQNLDAVRGAFQFTDAHLQVTRRIMNDMALGRLQMLVDEEGAPEAIDYDFYHQQYHYTRYVILFFQWLRKFLGWDKDEEKPEEPAEEPTDDFTFGGDYAGPNIATSEGHREDGQGDSEELGGGHPSDAVPEVRAAGDAAQDA